MAKSPVNTEKKQAPRFKPGKSGNPNGRPLGSRNKATLAVEALLDGQSEALTQKVMDLALVGRCRTALTIPKYHISLILRLELKIGAFSF